MCRWMGLLFSLILFTACAQNLGNDSKGSGAAQQASTTPLPTPTPMPPQVVTYAAHPVYRSYLVIAGNGDNADYLFSTNQSEGSNLGYVTEGVAFELYDGGAPTRSQIYRCITKGTEQVKDSAGNLIGTRVANSHFLSTDPNCEGSSVDPAGPVGFIENAATANAAVVVYRCYNLYSTLVTQDATECTNIAALNQITFGYTP